MIQISYDTLPQPIKSQYRQKRVQWAAKCDSGFGFVVKTARGVHRWVFYAAHGWKREKVKV